MSLEGMFDKSSRRQQLLLHLVVVVVLLVAKATPSCCSASHHHHDYIIIGAGPAGLQLGYYLQRAGRDYVILERDAQAGQISLTSHYIIDF